MDADLVALARRQHGLLTRHQLRAAGLSRHATEWLVTGGRTHLVHPGVFALGPASSTAARDLAAVLACGPGAALSHRSAAWRWGLPVARPAAVEVTVRRTRIAPLSGVLVHRSRRPVETVIRHGIPVTGVPRTLVDLADVAPYDVLHRAAMEAEHRRLIRLADLVPIPGRVGNRSLERLLDHVRERTRSELEKEVLRIVRRAGLPDPSRNVAVGRFVIDLAWPAQRVAVEADSWTWHSSREAFEADRARDLELRTMGWTVLRVTWRQLRERPSLLLDALATC